MVHKIVVLIPKEKLKSMLIQMELLWKCGMINKVLKYKKTNKNKN